MANHAGPGVGLRKEGLRRAGSVGCCRPLSCPARAPRALLATAGRYGVTGVTVHNSDLSETGARLNKETTARRGTRGMRRCTEPRVLSVTPQRGRPGGSSSPRGHGLAAEGG